MANMRYTAGMGLLELAPRNDRIPTEAYVYVVGLLAEGYSIPKAIEKASQLERWSLLPEPSGVLAWVAQNPERSAFYETARAAAAELGATEVQHIADSALDGVADDPGLMTARIGHARLMIDTRKWNAEKLQSKRYGQRVAHDHSGNISISLDTGIRRIEGPMVDAVVRTASLLEDADDASVTLELGASRDALEAAESPARAGRASSLLDD